MNSPDFAELKRVLCEKIYVDIYVQREHDTAIISELIDIIQSQSEALEKVQIIDDKCWQQENNDWLTLALHGVSNSTHRTVLETNTRLQKLRDGYEH